MSYSGEHESCADFLDRIVYMLDNELDDNEVVAVRLHLDECGPCLEKYDVQRTIKMIVARSCTESAPAELRERVKVRLRQVQIQITEG
jgi:mycothiol system anti-sigma-R factor